MARATHVDARTRAAVSLARSTARRIMARSPHALRNDKVEVDRLACELGVEVAVQKRLYSPARWHHFEPDPREPTLPLWDATEAGSDRIEVRANLRNATRRFALAHELGHIVLHREHRALAESLAEPALERFANVFAAELLMPPPVRAKLRIQFRKATSPVDLLRLGDLAGVPPRTILRFAKAEQWLRGTDVIWLDVRQLANRFTGSDRRLRVHDVVLDGGRWFFPPNRSVAGVFGSDRWLCELGRYVAEREGRLELVRRSRGPGPRFPRISVRVWTRALRLRPAASQGALDIVVVSHPASASA